MFASATSLLLSQCLNVCRYHSMTLLKFMGLITDFFGGKARMLAALSGQRVSPNPFPCCCCCCLPMVAINRYTPDTNLKVGLFKQLAVESEIVFGVLQLKRTFSCNDGSLCHLSVLVLEPLLPAPGAVYITNIRILNPQNTSTCIHI